MAAVVVSARPMTANQMPYHRRSGAIHCAPVKVIERGDRQRYVQAEDATAAQHSRLP